MELEMEMEEEEKGFVNCIEEEGGIFIFVWWFS